MRPDWIKSNIIAATSHEPMGLFSFAVTPTDLLRALLFCFVLAKRTVWIGGQNACCVWSDLLSTKSTNAIM